MLNRKYFVLTFSFIPIIFFIGEALSFGLITLKKIHFPSKFTNVVNHNQVYDQISGTDRYSSNKKDLENEKAYINKHGLVKTSFISNSDIHKDIKGVLITGNSTAEGYPLTQFGLYKDSFVNKLETKIRKIDSSIDLVNLSYMGMNSWQEKIQLTRYFNSEVNHKDLPSDIKLIASIGGIQDFWSFIDLLYFNAADMKNYSYANGMLLGIEKLNYFNEPYKAFQGNVLSGFKVFITSITNFFRKSNMLQITQSVTRSVFSKNLFNQSKEKSSSHENELPHIISNKINISLSEYYRRKDLAIKSVARNFKSIKSFNDRGKFIFIYLPTKFGFTPNQNNIDNRFKYKSKLNASDLYLLEKDYKKSLINYLSIEGIKVINISTKAKDNWFYYESHYSWIGHEEIFNLILPTFSNFLEMSK